jgi:hypothetical protein
MIAPRPFVGKDEKLTAFMELESAVAFQPLQ